jgi:hypothetical protein
MTEEQAVTHAEKLRLRAIAQLSENSEIMNRCIRVTTYWTIPLGILTAVTLYQHGWQEARIVLVGLLLFTFCEYLYLTIVSLQTSMLKFHFEADFSSWKSDSLFERFVYQIRKIIRRFGRRQ